MKMNYCRMQPELPLESRPRRLSRGISPGMGSCSVPATETADVEVILDNLEPVTSPPEILLGESVSEMETVDMRAGSRRLLKLSVAVAALRMLLD